MMFGWVSVKERMPAVKLSVNQNYATSKQYLVSTVDHRFVIAHYEECYTIPEHTGWYEARCGASSQRLYAEIAFWSPLPPYPIEVD